MTYYIAFDNETRIVYGLADTAQAAINNAAQYVDEMSRIETAEVDAEFAARVEANGDVKYHG